VPGFCWVTRAYFATRCDTPDTKIRACITILQTPLGIPNAAAGYHGVPECGWQRPLLSNPPINLALSLPPPGSPDEYAPNRWIVDHMPTRRTSPSGCQ